MLTITLWELYEQSATPVPRNSEAGLLGISERTVAKAGLEPATQAQIERQVDRAVKRQIATMRNDLDDWTAETAQLEDEILDKTHKANSGKASVTSPNGKAPGAKPEPTAAVRYKEALASMLFGGPEPSGDGVLDFVGAPGRMSTIKLSIDTTNAHGAVTTVGGSAVADAFYEESPARILQLPRRIENIFGDLSVPTLSQEPNSAMVAQNAARLAVVDPTLSAAPPMLSPHRLQTVADISLQTTFLGPGFEDVLLDWLMTASDRQMAVQLLRGDGTGSNLVGIVNQVGILSTDYATTDKGAQGGFFDAEDALAVETPADRRVWVLSENLFRQGRRVLREPGSGDFVIRNWGGRTRVLDGTEVIRSNVLSAGYGLYGEWSAVTLATWQNVSLTVDRITQPGVLKISLARFYDFGVTRPARFSVLKPA